MNDREDDRCEETEKMLSVLNEIRDFQNMHGRGPIKDRFKTVELARQYSTLLKSYWGVNYALKDIGEDEFGYFQIPKQMLV